jgi:hypothetical protein
MRLTHFYHVFADGDWETPSQEHFEALIASELIDNLDDMFLGIVGIESNRQKVKRELPGIVIAEAETGWEQVTLNALHQFAETDAGAIFYAHTKGAWARSNIAAAWRTSMTHDTVTRWKECVDALQTVQACGPHMMRSSLPEHREHEFFFGGNFWWARSDYVATLEPVKTESRFQAEGWIGLNNPKMHSMRQGEPVTANFWKRS